MLVGLLPLVVAPSILFAGGTVVDGSGDKPYLGDVRVQGDQIIAVGSLEPLAGEKVVKVKGLVVAPGFIDAHSHAAGSIEDDPLAVSQITQGITTSVVGQDGGWDAPMKVAMGELKSIRPAINFASFSGHGGIRRKVMGEDYKRTASPLEIQQMKDILRTDMLQGSLGLSSGLEYDPGYYSDTAELIELAKVAAEFKGMYISHVRDESDQAFQAFDELVTIARAANLHAQISHIKLGTAAVWGKAPLTDAIGSKEGITADVYPYLYWQSTMAALSPSRDWDNRAIWEKGLADVGGPQNVRLTSYTHQPAWVGKTLTQIAEMTGRDPISIIQEVLRTTTGPKGSGRQSVVVTAMTEPDLEHFIASPRTMFCSDGSIGGSHPRGAGSFPRILGRYVRDRKIITLQEAVRKMTSFPAKVFGFKNRGRVAPGMIADLVIFNPAEIADRATPEHPTELSIGMKVVLVSGTVTLSEGRPTGARNGKIILKQ